MFTLNHFIWLGISIIMIVGMLMLVKYRNISFDTILTIMFITCVLSEVIKTGANMIEIEGGGRVLDPGDLPLHLCSIQIFFIFALKFCIKKTETKEKLIAFMIPTMLLGGVIALFVPTVGVRFNKLQVYQFFGFHAMIVFFAIYLIREKTVKYTWKVYGRNMGYLGIMAMCVTWINSILSIGYEKVNFMYLVRPPMSGLPLLNLDNGWWVYFFTLVSIVLIVMTIFHIVMILINNKHSNEAK